MLILMTMLIVLPAHIKVLPNSISRKRRRNINLGREKLLLPNYRSFTKALGIIVAVRLEFVNCFFKDIYSKCINY